jgi:hypothetical protein
MALTSRIVANVYGIDAYDVSKGIANGRKNYFPNTGNLIYDAPINTTYMGVTVNSVIEMLPTGLVVDSKKFYCVETVAQLVTNGI